MEELFTIRQEEPSDYEKVNELVKISFASNSDDDGTTHEYLKQIRKKDTFIPELSLITENKSGKIIGQIVLYKMAIKTSEKNITELLLSPISVHPDYFRKGIARSMIKKSFKIAKEMGYKAVFLCGNPEIYGKFGFNPSFNYNIFHIEDTNKNAEWCMVYELIKGSLSNIDGIVDIV